MNFFRLISLVLIALSASIACLAGEMTKEGFKL